MNLICTRCCIVTATITHCACYSVFLHIDISEFLDIIEMLPTPTFYFNYTVQTQINNVQIERSLISLHIFFIKARIN